ncbi:MAG: insulinase family protein [Saprospiraceae bacterium]|nr:insulinase family protein [Saprospiraceae bacterium]
MKTIYSIFVLLVLTVLIACSPKINQPDKPISLTTDQSDAISIKKEHTSLDPNAEIEASIMASKIPVDPSFRTGILENGMHYFIKQNPKPENRVELRLALNAGSIDEDDDQKGLAHFIEHMQFNGTENFSKNELVNYLERVGTKFGADLNAYTSFDKTVYRLQVRTDVSNQLDTGLLVIHDWAGRATLDPVEIDKERGVVIAEWRSRLSPSQRIMEQILPVTYKDSKYKDRLPIGDPEIIKNSDYNTVKRFYKEWYRPELMALVIVGDIDVDKMEAQIIKMFSSFTNPPDARKPLDYKIPFHKGTLVKIVTDKESPSTSVQILNKVPKKFYKVKADLLEDIKRDLFSMMINSRLDELRNSSNPPFIRAFSGYSSDLGDIDMFRSSASAAEGKAMDALKAVATESERVLRFGFQQSELDRQLTNMLKNAERQTKELDKTESAVYCNRAVNYFLDGDPLLSSDQFYNFLNFNKSKISLYEINEFAKEWLKDDNRVISITGPDKEGLIMPTEKEITDFFDGLKNIKLEKYTDKTTDKPLFSKVLATTKVEPVMSYDKYGISKIKLANGIEIYYKKTSFKNDEIIFSSYSKGGTSLYDDNDFLNAKFAGNAVAEMGLSEFDNTQLGRLLTGKSASVYAGIGSMYQYISGRSTLTDLETMFQLINLRFTEPRNDATSFASYINRSKGMYSNMLKNPDYYFSDVLGKIQYNNHPRAGGIPKSEDFDKLNINEVYRIYKERFADAGSFKFFFVGSFDEKILMDYCSRYLGNLPTTRTNISWLDRNVDLVKGNVRKEVFQGSAPKAYVDITYHGDFKWTADNGYIIRSLIDVLRIKLRESLREDIGGVYGVRASGGGYNEPKETYSINISFNCDPAKANELTTAAREIIRKLKNEGPDADVLLKIKETQKQERVKALNENDYWLNMIESTVQDQLDFSEISIETLENRIGKLTAEDVQNAAVKYFDEQNMIEVVMYPEGFKR